MENCLFIWLILRLVMWLKNLWDEMQRSWRSRRWKIGGFGGNGEEVSRMWKEWWTLLRLDPHVTGTWMFLSSQDVLLSLDYDVLTQLTRWLVPCDQNRTVETQRVQSVPISLSPSLPWYSPDFQASLALITRPSAFTCQPTTTPN